MLDPHENRPLYALYISDESNITNLDQIKTGQNAC